MGRGHGGGEMAGSHEEVSPARPNLDDAGSVRAAGSGFARTSAGVAPRSRSARRLGAPSRLLSRRPAASVSKAWCA